MSYDPKKVTIVVNGTFITGKADGDFFQYSKEEDDITPYKGADGEVEYAENPDESAMITITLKDTSPSNSYMSGLAQAKTPISLSVTDSNEHGLSVSGEEGRIVKTPDASKSKEIGTREWVIHLPKHQTTET